MHAGRNKLQTVPNASFLVKNTQKNVEQELHKQQNNKALWATRLPLNVMAAQHGVHLLKSLSPSTHAIFLTLTHTQTHTPTFTLPLDFDPSPSLCISYELSEKTQWIEWQRSKARPCNRPGWRGDGWLCVYECVGASAYLCVFDSHLLQSRIFRIWICPSWLVFEPGLFSRTYTHRHMHTHTHASPIPLHFEDERGQVTGF